MFIKTFHNKNHCYVPSSSAAENLKAHRHHIPSTEKGYFRDLFQFLLNIDGLAQLGAARWMLVEELAIKVAELYFTWEGHRGPWSSSRDLGRIQQPFFGQLSTRKPVKHEPVSQGLLPKPARHVSISSFDTSRQQDNPSQRWACGWTGSDWDLMMRSSRVITTSLWLLSFSAGLQSVPPRKKGVFWCDAHPGQCRHLAWGQTPVITLGVCWPAGTTLFR